MALTIQDFLQAASAGDVYRTKPQDTSEALAGARAEMKARLEKAAAKTAAAEQQAYARRIADMERAEQIRQFGVTSAVSQAQADTSRMQAERADRELLAKGLEGVHSLDPTKRRAALEGYRARGGVVEPVPSGQDAASPVSQPADVAEALGDPGVSQAAKDVLGDVAGEEDGDLSKPENAQAAKTLLKNKAGLQIGILDPSLDREENERRKDEFETAVAGTFGDDNIGQQMDAVAGAIFIANKSDAEKAMKQLLEYRGTLQDEIDKDLDRISREELAAMRLAAELAVKNNKPIDPYQMLLISRHIMNDTERRLKNAGYEQNVLESLNMKKSRDFLVSGNPKGIEDAMKMIHKIADPGVLLEGEKANMVGPMDLAHKINFYYSQWVKGTVPEESIKRMLDLIPTIEIGLRRKKEDLFRKELILAGEFALPQLQTAHWQMVRAKFPDLAATHTSAESARDEAHEKTDAAIADLNVLAADLGLE